MILRTVRVAAIQATPVILDAEATVAKAVALLGEAAAAGAELAVLPETFVSLYPSNAWAHQAADVRRQRRAVGADVAELRRRPGAARRRARGGVLRRSGIHAVIGVNERESERPGTLYNTMLWLGPGGLLHKHRKLMPTQHERLFHGIGRGDDLRVVDTPCGRIGGLICWENRMPLARYAVYRQGPQIWVAPTADDSDGWVAHMRAIAIESGAFVVSVPQYIPRSAFPDDFPLALPDRDVFGNGGAVIVEPTWGRDRRRAALRRGGHARPRLRPARRACTPSACSTRSVTTRATTCSTAAALRGPAASLTARSATGEDRP